MCPISGVGKLSAPERKRRAREIIAESGADTVEHFNKVVGQQKKDCVTFKQQSLIWLEHLRTRKRKPVEPGTIDEWERILNKDINPEIGDYPISNVNNGVLKKLVALMVDKGLSGKTIENYLQVPKMVVASVVDDDGNQVYPRKWNHEFMDKLSSSNIIRPHLHPALKELDYVNPHTGTHKAGNHAFRRFRNTYLKNYTDCPKGLYDYWLGHAGKDMSDLYDKIREDVAFRKMWAEKSGFGFELPLVVPNVPKKEDQSEAAKAA
ncbi:MAG: hypothetical protein ABSA80_04400 [Terriglobales bacterium]